MTFIYYTDNSIFQNLESILLNYKMINFSTYKILKNLINDAVLKNHIKTFFVIFLNSLKYESLRRIIT